MGVIMMPSEFFHRGKLHRRVPADALDRWIVGLDIGQAMDSTALCALNHRVVPLDDWQTVKHPNGNVTLRQNCEESYEVRHLERLRLNLSYPEMVAIVANIMARPLLRDGATLCVDQTGVGAPVADLFDDAGLRPQRVVITGGLESSEPSPNRHHVSKSHLISTLDARLHSKQLRFAAALTEAPALRDELRDFRRKVSESSRVVTYGAQVGRHDDLVLSVAIACWWASQPERKVFVSTVRGLF